MSVGLIILFFEQRTCYDSEFKVIVNLFGRGGCYDFADEIRGCRGKIAGVGEWVESCRADGLGEFTEEGEGIAKAVKGFGSSLFERTPQWGAGV